MPTLADIYSAADSFKRRLADAAMNPGASLQQMLGYANDRARGLNEQIGQAASQPEFVSPQDRQMAARLAESYNPVGMTVYHGSPHVFERFDLSKIGTGEGNQAYGRGLYMAEARPTAEEYASKLSADTGFSYGSQNNLTREQVQDLVNKKYSKRYVEGVTMPSGVADKVIDDIVYGLRRDSEFPRKYKPEGERAKIYKELMNEITHSNPGSLYKVDLPDTHVRRMLDWDAPLKDQPYPVRNLAKKLGMDMKDLGGDLIGKIGKGEEGRKILQEAGIPGIKYYDQMSRGDQTGTRNFVVFDPNHLTILERNNQPIK